jgi:transposase
MCDDYAGYKAAFAQGVTEAGLPGARRRKFFDLHANKSQVAEFAPCSRSAWSMRSSAKSRA